MRRALFITASLTCLAVASYRAATAKASDAPNVPNIGFVLYTKSYAPGTLNARWMYGTRTADPG